MLKNVVEILTDSPSPAVILSSDNDTHVSSKIYYSSIRQAIKEQSRKEPFSNIKPGTAISYLSTDSFTSLFLFFLITSQRGVANPLNPNYNDNELEEYLTHIAPAAIIISKPSESLLELGRKLHVPLYLVQCDFVTRFQSRDVTSGTAVAEPRVTFDCLYSVGNPVFKQQNLIYNVNDICLLVHTSGTTGKPKNVPLTHENVLYTLKNMTETYRLGTSDATLLVMPLFHTHGLIGAALSTLFGKGTIVIPKEVNSNLFWKDINAFGVVELKTVLMKMERSWKVPVIEAYIVAEAAHHVTSNALPSAGLNGIRKPGSAGFCRGQIRVRIMTDKGERMPRKEVGEICISGPNVMADTFFKSNKMVWLRTGDYGYLDENKYLVIVERVKEQIRYKDKFVSPKAIESAIMAHPKVIEAVVVGTPDMKRGENIEAMVVGHPGLTEQQLMDHCKKTIPETVPHRVHLVDHLPKTATGKIQRHLIVTTLLAKL
ncbi:hypothetical protein EDD86DRAFT_232387 [Gorgonomyces haynaldii]|nr:hypothetical protein EDD86DRAFT_232387 [Gorgonomyces haynaldii]